MSRIKTEQERWEANLRELQTEVTSPTCKSVCIEYSTETLFPVEYCMDTEPMSHVWRFLDLTGTAVKLRSAFYTLPPAQQLQKLQEAQAYVVRKHVHGELSFFLSGDPCPVCGEIKGDCAGELLPPVHIMAVKGQEAEKRACAREIAQALSLRVSGAVYQYTLCATPIGCVYVCPFRFHSVEQAMEHAKETCKKWKLFPLYLYEYRDAGQIKQYLILKASEESRDE